MSVRPLRFVDALPFVLLTVLAAACGGSSGSAAAPTQPAATAFEATATPALVPTAVRTPTLVPPPPFQAKTIDTRPGVGMRFLFAAPVGAKTALVLFSGGDGSKMFGVNADGSVHLGSNFLVRTAPDFVKQGFAVAVPDVPSDQAGGMSPNFRTSPQHAQDVAKLLDFLASQNLTSIYLVGTSNGTFSAAYVGSVINDPRVKGVVLTSTVNASPRFAVINLAKITAPVLVVHHHDDGCSAAPFAGDAALLPKMTGSSKVDFVEVDGGSPPLSTDPCEALAQHGYYGIEAPVVQTISDWVNGKPVPPKIGS